MRNHLLWANIKVDLSKATGVLQEDNLPTIDLPTKAEGLLPRPSLPTIDLASEVEGILPFASLPPESQITFMQFDGGNATSDYSSNVLRFDMGHAS